MSDPISQAAADRNLNNELAQAASRATVAKTRIGSPANWLEFLQLYDWSPGEGWDLSKVETSQHIVAGAAPKEVVDLSFSAVIRDRMKQKLFERIAAHEWTPWSSEAWGFRLFESDVVHRMWRKSSYQHGPGGVEVAPLEGGIVAIRDGKHREGPFLQFTMAEWHSFMDGAKANEFDELLSPRRTA